MTGISDQTTPAKDVVVDKENDATEHEKSEKKVPTTPMTESTESVIVTKPHIIKEELVDERQNVEVETIIHLHDEEFMKDLCRIAMTTKSQFKDSGHFKSSRYYLLEAYMLSNMGINSGLLVNLTSMASFYPCGATYRSCYSEAPMIRMMSKGINDLSSHFM